jgi:formylglycine-generating enzyme required for sulfatase activity
MKKFKMVSLVISFLLLSSRVSPIQEESSDLERIVYSNKTVSTTNQQRIALLIGNQEYKKGRLDNPHNDVDGMEAALKEVGFQVRKLKDQSLWDMEQAIIGFGKDLKQDKNTVGLFYFSGHGMQYQGKNFLFPIGAMESVAVPGHLQMETLNAEYLLAIMKDAENRLNLVFLDACRNNPFHHKGWFKGNGLKKGLAPMPPPSGSLIAYATSANHQALSAKGQHNSPYILHLKQEILKPGISIFDMLTNVRAAVKKETSDVQESDFYSGLDGQFCFKGPCRQVQTQDKFFRDRLKDGGFGPEMVRIPAGRFRMGDIQGGGESDEKPVHLVSVKQFAMGKYEVTFAEYDKFAQATGRKKPDDEGWGRGHRPVINVSWNDAVAYAGWLSQQTGRQYRLPSEAEWEYAARAKTTTSRYWGNSSDDACRYANVHDKTSKKENGFGWTHHNCTDGYAKTAPVGSLKSNAFGLYDTVGNVWEWVADSWHENYKNAPNDGRVWKTGADNSRRVLRGCSWDSFPVVCRSAVRVRSSSVFRVQYIGFRVAVRL